jgi:hypothetical protein
VPSRRSVILSLAGFSALLAWRSRLLQVCSFSAVAAIAKLLHSDPVPNFLVLSPAWKSVEPSRKYPASGSRGMITYHPWYHQFQPSVANRCLAEAAELGAGYIRIDIRWKDLFPDGHVLNEAAWTWYDNYLTAATNWYGLKTFIVLSNAPRAALRFPVDQRLNAWSEYVQVVAERVGERCYGYQILNEPNNPVFKIFPDDCLMSALLTAASIIRRINPEARTAINILADLPGWLGKLEDICEKTDGAIDIAGLDFYPDTWTVSVGSAASNWSHLTNRIIAKRGNEGSPLQGVPIAILETGYSTNVPWFRDERHQARYFEALGRAAKSLDDRLGRDAVLFLGVHELTDSDSNGRPVDPEAHFGLLRSDTLEHKAGYRVVQGLFRHF